MLLVNMQMLGGFLARNQFEVFMGVIQIVASPTFCHGVINEIVFRFIRVIILKMGLARMKKLAERTLELMSRVKSLG